VQGTSPATFDHIDNAGNAGCASHTHHRPRHRAVRPTCEPHVRHDRERSTGIAADRRCDTKHGSRQHQRGNRLGDNGRVRSARNHRHRRRARIEWGAERRHDRPVRAWHRPGSDDDSACERRGHTAYDVTGRRDARSAEHAIIVAHADADFQFWSVWNFGACQEF
jgi:hypothetical protein